MSDHVSRREADGGARYSLTLKNESVQPWVFYVFQRLPDLSPPVFSLAWLVSPSPVGLGDQVTFTWEVTYDFLWGETGVLKPGVIFRAAGEIGGISPDTENSTTFTAVPEPHFTAPVTFPLPGSLQIKMDDTVPMNQFAVSFGMAGAGVYAVQAASNVSCVVTATPDYWIAAGQSMQAGMVLDLQLIVMTVGVKYPVDTFSRTMILNQANEWISGD